MPTIKDKATGKVVADLPYNQQGEEQAKEIVESRPNLEVDLAPGGSSNAMERTQRMYPGGGKVGYNVPQYEEGGRVSKMKDDARKRYENLQKRLKDEAKSKRRNKPRGKEAAKGGPKKGITGPYSEKLGKEGYAGEVRKQKTRKWLKGATEKLKKESSPK